MAETGDRDGFSADAYCKQGKLESLRQSVFASLDENLSLTAKPLAKLLELPWPKYKGYLDRLRFEWKAYRRNEQGLKCSSHGWRGWLYLPRELVEVRDRAVGVGWVRSRARNRWLLWRDRLGRLQWFETGRINVYVRKPANFGKAHQLICNGFSFTGLVTDIKVLEWLLTGLRFKGAHYVFHLGQWLPKLTIDLFQKSNGIVIKVGDDSHPDSLEVLSTYPDWAERNERVTGQLADVLEKLCAFNGGLGFSEKGIGQSTRGFKDYVS